MDHQSVTFAVWLAIPVLCLIGAYVALLRTRHQLRGFQQSSAATPMRLAQAPAAEQRNRAFAS